MLTQLRFKENSYCTGCNYQRNNFLKRQFFSYTPFFTKTQESRKPLDGLNILSFKAKNVLKMFGQKMFVRLLHSQSLLFISWPTKPGGPGGPWPLHFFSKKKKLFFICKYIPIYTKISKLFTFYGNSSVLFIYVSSIRQLFDLYSPSQLFNIFFLDALL